MPDKFSAVWVSHSSSSDFLKCPRAYYLNNIYRHPETGHKIQLMSPPLALGSAVHEVLESLSVLLTQDRFKQSLIEKFDTVWQKFRGKKGGFTNDETEQQYKKRGEAMLRRVMANPGPLKNLAVKIKEETPWYWLSEEDNIILCGKVDWLEYLKDEDVVHIIDFKTGKVEEDGKSLQLPIYYLLVQNTQQRQVAKASYWYLESKDEPTEQELPDLTQSHQRVLDVAKQIKLARKLGLFKCPQGERGCFACRPLEQIVRGEAEQVGVSSFNQDVYVLTDQPTATDASEGQSLIL